MLYKEYMLVIYINLSNNNEDKLQDVFVKQYAPGQNKIKNQGVFVKHYSMPPAATKSKKLFLASRSKSRSQGQCPWCHLKGHH